MTVRIRRTLTAACLMVLAATAPAWAQGKIRIAIWEVENHAETSWWFHGQMGGAVRNTLDTEFSENKALSEKFSIIERSQLNLILKEQGLGAAGALDPQTAAKVGKVLGVKYIIVGGIDKFSINNTRGGIAKFGGVGGNMVSANALINIRMVDTTTAERIVSLSGEGDIKKGGGFFKGTSLSRDAEWGIASEAIEKATKATIEKLVSGDYLARIGSAATPVGGLEGKVVKVEGGKAWINLGANSGIKVGDKLTFFNIGEALIDPDTGVKLGADETKTGTGSVVEVQAQFAIVSLTGTTKAKDTVRKQ
ncbi:MAG: CsgG/HfaB family protein [Vicinamibacterales bacterium]